MLSRNQSFSILIQFAIEESSLVYLVDGEAAEDVIDLREQHAEVNVAQVGRRWL
jgi:hypothetical protein